MEVSLYKADLNDAVTVHEMKVKAFMPLLEKYQDFETSPANETVERIITQINQSFTDYFIIHHFEVAVGGIRVVKKIIKSIVLVQFLYCQNIKEKELLKKSLQWLSRYMMMQSHGN